MVRTKNFLGNCKSLLPQLACRLLAFRCCLGGSTTTASREIVEEPLTRTGLPVLQHLQANFIIFGLGVIGAKSLPANANAFFEHRLGFLEIILFPPQRREVVEARGHPRVLIAVHLLPDLDGLLVQRLGLAQLALRKREIRARFCGTSANETWLNNAKMCSTTRKRDSAGLSKKYAPVLSTTPRGC